jgi:hypothetical protein
MPNYIFTAGEWHGVCLVEEMIEEGELAPAARDMQVEFALWQGASANAIDMDDEASYDSDQWPKLHDGSLEYEDGSPRCCDRCLTPLAENPASDYQKR